MKRSQAEYRRILQKDRSLSHISRLLFVQVKLLGIAFENIGLALFSRQQSADILAVSVPSHKCQNALDDNDLYQHCAADAEHAHPAFNNELDPGPEIEKEGSERHKLGSQIRDKEKQEPGGDEGPVESEDEPRHDRDAFAALEAHINGIVMTQHDPGKGPYLEQIDGLRVGFAEQGADKQNGDEALEHITQKNRQAGFGAQDPHGICGPGIAAPVFTDVDPLALPEKVGGLKKAEDISNHETDDTQNNKLIHLDTS